MTSIEVERCEERVSIGLAGGAVIPRVLSATDNTARVALVAGGALLLGGDQVSIDIVVGEGCTLHVQDIGGTVAYDADGVESEWAVTARLEAGATLVWHALPMVVATGANVRRSFTASLADAAHLCLRETIVLGRYGETGGRIESHTDVAGLFVEHLSLDGSAPQPGITGDATVLDSVLIAGVRPPAAEGTLEFEGAGALARYLGAEAHRSPLDEVFRTWAALEPVKEKVHERR